ncbi:MAG: MFS transporter, partial [Firmicutes bacterium]|nr:MFS transporter [Bacillota bacterium]
MQSSSVTPDPQSTYRRLFSNRTWVFLSGGNTVSGVGDAFFTLAVIWIIYAASHSLLQTALIQVVWHLDRLLLGPIAGTVADRRNRTHILLAMNLGSAAVAAAVAILLHFAHL